MPTRLMAFDLDDTLAPSKSPLPERMAGLIVRLLERIPVGIISGGQFSQFRTQVIDRLDAPAAVLENLYLMPVTGTRYYRFADGEWHEQYSEDLTPEQRRAALDALEEVAKGLGYWESDTYGPVLEDRGSQITFSAFGQAAPPDIKAAWDPTDEKKNRLREAVQAKLPGLSVRSGGSTSIDITREGIDKAYGMRKLVEVTGIPLDDMLFVGDRLDPHGNDYPVKAMGARTHAVRGWEDTADYLERLLADGLV